MAGRVAPSVPGSQDQQNNSVKYPKTVQDLYSGKLSQTITLRWVEPASPFEKLCARNTWKVAYLNTKDSQMA